jgi:hypothetical protein
LIESLKLLKLRKLSFYNKSGDMFTSFRVWKTSFKFNAELKSHYELVGRDLARFYESKGEDYKTKIKDIISVWTKRDSKNCFGWFCDRYLVNNGINEGPSGTKIYYNT